MATANDTAIEVNEVNEATTTTTKTNRIWASKVNAVNVKRQLDQLMTEVVKQECDQQQVCHQHHEDIMSDFYKIKTKYEQQQDELEAGCRQVLGNNRQRLTRVIAAINSNIDFEDNCEIVNVTALVKKYQLTAASWFLHLMLHGQTLGMGQASYQASSTPRDLDAANEVLQSYYYGIDYYNGMPIKQDFMGFALATNIVASDNDAEEQLTAEQPTDDSEFLQEENRDRALLSLKDYDDRNEQSLLYQFGIYFSKIYSAK